MKTILRLTGKQHAQLRSHLFPGDGNEAIAFALCGRRNGKKSHALSVHEIFPIPHNSCRIRTPQQIVWPTDMLSDILKIAEQKGLALLKIHSHPGYWPQFSPVDNQSDRELFPSIYCWFDNDLPHASAVMLPDGEIFGRVVDPNGEFTPLYSITVVGDDIHVWHSDKSNTGEAPQEFAKRHTQAFGAGTTALLQKLSIAVVGCSGTGSPVIEMLARLGVGELVLIDPDRLETKNQNRIINAMERETREQWFKVDLFADAIQRMGLGTHVEPIAKNLYDTDVMLRVAECDIVIGCMDSIDGRDLLNRIATFYSIPYFDVGVHLSADGNGGINEISGSVHYLQPDGSSLYSRGLYTSEQLSAAILYRTNPTEYQQQLRDKYIQGIHEDRPAVISVNFLYASLAVNELLARLHPYRVDDNSTYNWYIFILSQARVVPEAENGQCQILNTWAGRGDMRPFLNKPVFSLTYHSQEQSSKAVDVTTA